jgi:RHS repeat-associated protein
MIFFYHKDHLGSSTQISDPGANIIQHIEYLPYGELFFERRDYWNTPYKFNAKELDEQTGLYYYGARYYTPEVSIWLSVDPLADKSPFESPYTYCSNNPIIYIDPTGMYKLPTAEEYEAAGLSDAEIQRFETVVANMKDLVQNNPQLLESMVNSTGYNKEDILTHMEIGEGPKINLTDYIGARSSSKDGFEIGYQVIKHFTSIRSSDEEYLAEQAFGMAMVLIDEYTHWGDKNNNNGNNTGQWSMKGKTEIFDADIYTSGGHQRVGTQNWKISPTGHRGGDPQLYGFGVDIATNDNGGGIIIRGCSYNVIRYGDPKMWVPKYNRATIISTGRSLLTK